LAHRPTSSADTPILRRVATMQRAVLKTCQELFVSFRNESNAPV
jgi:hypothetical protein